MLRGQCRIITGWMVIILLDRVSGAARPVDQSKDNYSRSKARVPSLVAVEATVELSLVSA